MTGQFVKVSATQFDQVLEKRTRDEHELLESRFFDRNNRMIARVVRALDEDNELVPEAELWALQELI